MICKCMNGRTGFYDCLRAIELRCLNHVPVKFAVGIPCSFPPMTMTL